MLKIGNEEKHLNGLGKQGRAKGKNSSKDSLVTGYPALKSEEKTGWGIIPMEDYNGLSILRRM